MPQRSINLPRSHSWGGLYQDYKTCFLRLGFCLIYASSAFQTFLRSQETEVIRIRIVVFLSTLAPVQLLLCFLPFYVFPLMQILLKSFFPAKIFINFYTRTQLLSIINIGCTLFLSGQEVSTHHTCTCIWN